MTTTATRPRKKAAKKKAAKKPRTKKKTSKKSATSTSRKKKKTTSSKKKTQKKKPKWVLVTYKQIEARRGELGLSKSAMAELLGVTNSTYHNWRRGTTVPHEGQQQKLLARMHGGPSVVPTSKPAGRTSGTNGKIPHGEATSDPFGSDDFFGEMGDHDTGEAAGTDPDENPRTFARAGRVPVGGTRCSTRSSVTSVSDGQSHTRSALGKVHPTVAVARNAAVADIVSAYIAAHKNKASAGSVIELVENLHRSLP